MGIGMMAGKWSRFIHGRALKLLLDHSPPHAKIIDLGAGHGAFAKRLLKAGYSVVAIEKDAKFNAPGLKCIRTDLNGIWPTNLGGPFDVAVAIEIIEHLESPFHFFRQVNKILKRGGILLISTPNPLNFIERWKFLVNGRITMLEHQDHRTVLFPQILDQLCDEFGFTIVQQAYDVKSYRIAASLSLKLLKIAVYLISHLIIRGTNYLEGGSNIWVLRRHDY